MNYETMVSKQRYHFVSKVGRPSYEKERWIQDTIVDLLLSKPDGLLYKELVRMAGEYGIAKSTVSRYLPRFEKGRLVLHDGKYYRINPLFNYRVRAEAELTLSIQYRKTGIERRFRPAFWVTSDLLEEDVWGGPVSPPLSLEDSPENITIDYTDFGAFYPKHWTEFWGTGSPPDQIPPWDENKLRRSYDAVVTIVMSQILNLMQKMVNAPNLNVALRFPMNG